VLLPSMMACNHSWPWTRLVQQNHLDLRACW
jgi:hypothetical protein